MPEIRGIRFIAATGNDFTDAVYSLTIATLEAANDPEATESLAHLHAAGTFQVAWDNEGMVHLFAGGQDIKAVFKEEDVNALVEEVVAKRGRPN